MEAAPADAAATTTTEATTTTTTTTTAAAPTGTLTALLAGDPRFSTLVDLVQKAGLAETLGSGEYTVFAPTNDAFAKITPADLTALGNDPAKLKQVLLFHVVPSRVTETALASSPELTSAGNGKLTLTRMTNPDRTMIGTATITAGAPLTASNGLVYVIDTVLMPTP